MGIWQGKDGREGEDNCLYGQGEGEVRCQGRCGGGWSLRGLKEGGGCQSCRKGEGGLFRDEDRYGSADCRGQSKLGRIEIEELGGVGTDDVCIVCA